MTLMACYGAPTDWFLSETDSGESTLLDADNATAAAEVTFTANRAALSEAVSDEAAVSLTLTPLEAGTEVLLASTINGTMMEESHTATGTEPIAITLPADSFSECSEDVCTQTISFSLELVSGRAVYEGTATIDVYGSDESMPENAEVTVTWAP